MTETAQPFMTKKLHIVIPLYGDQVGVLFADKWSAQRRVNAMVRSRKHARNELWVGEVELGSRYDRLLKTIVKTPYRRKSK